MVSKIKNIIIFTAIFALLVLAYVFFIKSSPEEENLVSSLPTQSSAKASGEEDTLNQNSAIAKNFLSILLSVKSIKLDDAIFSNKVFNNLRDSTILLVPSGDEGRPNPFAPIGYEASRIP